MTAKIQARPEQCGWRDRKRATDPSLQEDVGERQRLSLLIPHISVLQNRVKSAYSG